MLCLTCCARHAVPDMLCLTCLFCLFRINQEAEDRLAALSDALAAVKEQVGGQSRTLGEVRAAEEELRRLLVDKAGLADVQAVLQAQSAPPLVPVRFRSLTCCWMLYIFSGMSMLELILLIAVCMTMGLSIQ